MFIDRLLGEDKPDHDQQFTSNSNHRFRASQLRFQKFKFSFPMRVVLEGAVGRPHHGRAQVSAATFCDPSGCIKFPGVMHTRTQANVSNQFARFWKTVNCANRPNDSDPN